MINQWLKDVRNLIELKEWESVRVEAGRILSVLWSKWKRAGNTGVL